MGSLQTLIPSKSENKICKFSTRKNTDMRSNISTQSSVSQHNLPFHILSKSDKEDLVPATANEIFGRSRSLEVLILPSPLSLSLFEGCKNIKEHGSRNGEERESADLGKENLNDRGHRTTTNGFSSWWVVTEQ